MNKEQQKFFDAGKKQQEVEDMNLLGLLIDRLGGAIIITPSELLNEFYVTRTEDKTTGGFVIESTKDK